jgi:hypothetical protein
MMEEEPMRKTQLFTWIMLLLITSACIVPVSFESEADKESTSVAKTVVAMLDQTRAAATSTPYPTSTLQPTYTPFPTTIPQQPYGGKPMQPTPEPCNKAKLVNETIPDNTKIDAGDSFTKRWTMKNIGTCTWNRNYKFVFDDGDRMGGDKSQYLDENVHPGESIDLEVDLEAPDENDTYRGYWKMQTDDGDKFATVWVQIIVSEDFRVTSVNFDADPGSYSGVCPTTVNVEAAITVSDLGTVTYQWERSDGVTTDLYTVKFTEDHTKTVDFDWDIDATDTYSVDLYIDEPNHQWFGTLYFDVECTP